MNVNALCVRKLRVKVLCVQELSVPKLCVESRFPKRRGGEQGGFRQSQGREVTGQCLGVCPARRISPCCHTRLEIERRPQAHTTASSGTPGQRGDRRHFVGLLGTGTHSKTKNKPELTGTCALRAPRWTLPSHVAVCFMRADQRHVLRKAR